MDSYPPRFYEQRWFRSLATSVGIHLAFLVVALFIRVGMLPPKSETLDFRLKKVQTETVGPRGGGGGSGSPATGSKTSPFAQARNSSGKKSLDPSMAGTRGQTALRLEGPAQSPVPHDAPPVPSSAKNIDALILENEKDEASHRLAVKQESLNAFYQKEAAENARAQAPSGEGLMRTLSRSLEKIQLYSPSNVGINPEEGMPGFTPSAGGAGGSGGGIGMGVGLGAGNGSGNGLGPGEGVGEGAGASRFEPLDHFMDIQVYKYEDPADREKYLMIKIYAKKGSEALKVMPKEILFTIDCSLSISPERLDEFKRGITYCLTHLNSGDLFNIIAFRDEAIFFSPQSIPATPDAVKRAERFVSELRATRSTDVYGAFSEIISKRPARRPSNIILISDGRPTHGVVDSRDLINQVTRANGGTRPVFAFSGGAKVNRYLLDFIAYQNRGWSQFVRKSWDIHGGLSGFYDKIKDPVFLNLRYRLNNLDQDEVFPKSLPDFYRNAEFTLFGKYKDDGEFSMQLLGDVDGKTKELIFTRAMKDALPGDETIKRGYGFNKIYYLISRMTVEGQTPALRARIDELSRRYGIQTPYSADIESSDG